jgi:parvulin-like peptidyl-prolyl isomerase
LLLVACSTTFVGDEGPDDGPRAPRPAPELDVGAPQPAAAPASSELRAADPVATVAGEPLTSGDLLARLMHRESRLVFDTVDRLVSARLALAESQRLGILLDPRQVDEALAAAQAQLEQAIGLTGADLDRWLVEARGLEPTRYFAVLRDEVIEELLAERAMRAWTLASERCELSVILTRDEATAQALRGRLDAGEDFAELARAHSTDPSGEDGGRLPPIVRNELSPLASVAFRTEVGALAGPLQEGEDWLLLRIDARPEPLVGPWDVIGPAVEADLARTAVQDPEYWQWRAAMGRRYMVDLAPLLELTGESAPE